MRNLREGRTLALYSRSPFTDWTAASSYQLDIDTSETGRNRLAICLLSPCHRDSTAQSPSSATLAPSGPQYLHPCRSASLCPQLSNHGCHPHGDIVGFVLALRPSPAPSRVMDAILLYAKHAGSGATVIEVSTVRIPLSLAVAQRKGSAYRKLQHSGFRAALDYG